MKHSIKHSKARQLSALFVLVPMLLLTLAALSQPQRLVQFAQETFTEPPLFGCLQVGEGSKSTCASKLGITTAFTLNLHDRPIEQQTTVYYGDRLNGSVKFTNVGDLPIMLNNIGLGAQTPDKKTSRDFRPLKGQTTLQPKQEVTLPNASYLFKSPDPNKEWTVGTKIKTSGGEIPTADSKKKITVNATCTALRIKELTTKDKTNIRNFCGRNPKSKLCTSKQYCEIFKGTGCNQPNLYRETPGWQCDQNVYPPAPEQDILEELCRAHPDTDACKDFCERTVGTSLCPKKYIVIDTKTGRPVLRLKHPKAVYIHDLKGFPFEYPADYPKDLPRLGSSAPGNTRVLGIQTTDKSLLARDSGELPALGPLAPAKEPLAPLNRIQPVIPKQWKAPPPNKPASSNGGCAAGLVRVGVNGCFPPGNSAPAKQAGPPGTGAGTTGSNGCAPGMLRQGVNGCVRAEPNRVVPDGAGGFKDPKSGAKVDPKGGSLHICPGQNDPNKLCSDAAQAQEGDEGYATQCASGRKDVNPNDDPNGAPQYACCLDATKYVPGGGFCGRKASVWTKPAGKPGPGAKPLPGSEGECRPGNQAACDPNAPADYFGRVCSNKSFTGPNAHLCFPDHPDPALRDPVTPYQSTPNAAPYPFSPGVEPDPPAPPPAAGPAPAGPAPAGPAPQRLDEPKIPLERIGESCENNGVRLSTGDCIPVANNPSNNAGYNNCVNAEMQKCQAKPDLCDQNKRRPLAEKDCKVQYNVP